MYCPNIPVHPLNERGRPTITLHRKSSSGLQVQIFRSWEADQNPPRKRIVIFAVTANSSDADMVKCAQSGFDEFVTKPLTVEKLVDRLKMISSPSYDRKLDFMNTHCL
jgi:DNA-binding response OmpR family regulator